MFNLSGKQPGLIEKKMEERKMVFQTTYVDIEIRILGREAQGYPVEMTLNYEQVFLGGHLDPKSLPLPWVATASAEADGERLFRWLLADDPLKAAWAQARGQFPQRRIRFRVDPTAPELHAIPWELLRDSGKGSVPQDLAAAVATPFSRYLAGITLPAGPVIQRPIRALAAILNPANMQSKFNLSQIDVDREWAALPEATAGLEVEWALLTQPCTLSFLMAELRMGGSCSALRRARPLQRGGRADLSLHGRRAEQGPRCE